MSDKCKNIYKKALEMYIAYNIDFSKYDKEIEESGLFNKDILPKEKNISSKYLILSNDISIDKLSKEDKDILESSKRIDFQLLKMVSRTYKDILNNNSKPILTLELIPSNRNVKLKNNITVDPQIEQERFIINLTNQISKDIDNKLSVDCQILSTNNRLDPEII